MTPPPPPAVVLGGNRIPFARSNGAYAQASNQDMLTAALDGLVDALRPRGRAARRGRRRRGAQAQPRLQPDPRVRARLAASRPRRPPTTSSRRAAPASRPRSSSPTRSPSARSTSGIAGGVDTTSRRADRASTRTCARSCSTLNRAKSLPASALKRSRGCARGSSCPAIPRNAEPRTGLSMGEHAAMHRRASGASRARRRTSSPPPATSTSPPPTSAASSTTSSRPYLGPRARPEPAPGLHASRSSRSSSRSSAGDDGDDDRRQLDAADRRRRRPCCSRARSGRAERGLHAARLLRRRRDRGGRLRHTATRAC